MEEEPQTEENQPKYRRALWKFRAIVRTVIHNIPWLTEMHGLSISVQKNVRLLMSKKLTSSLKLKNKSLLLKPPNTRTKEDVGCIFRAISQLKALRVYPETVVMEIAACATFRYFEAGRTILRQDHPAYSLYFVVTGELKVIYTHPGDETTTVISTLRMGEMFGEISLINEVPRGATVISSTPVELLMVDGEDFKFVLKESLKGKQGKVLSFLDSISYFNDWDYKTRLNSSLLCHWEQFSKDATILGDSHKKKKFIYIVLSGVCSLIEDLDVDVRVNKAGNKTYTLHKSKPTPFTQDTSEAVKDLLDEQGETVNQSFATSQDITLISERKKSISKMRSNSKTVREDSIQTKESGRRSDKSGLSSIANKISVHDTLTRSERRAMASREDLTRENLYKSSIRFEIYRPSWTKTIYMEIATFREKACFCLGENMKRRRIIAATDVECLLLPHSFLVEGANSVIWARIKIFLDKHIPNTKQIFKEYLRQKRWRESIWKNINLHPTKNNLNNIHNVPYSIRIMNDFEYDSDDELIETS